MRVNISKSYFIGFMIIHTLIIFLVNFIKLITLLADQKQYDAIIKKDLSCP